MLDGGLGIPPRPPRVVHASSSGGRRRRSSFHGCRLGAGTRFTEALHASDGVTLSASSTSRPTCKLLLSSSELLCASTPAVDSQTSNESLTSVEEQVPDSVMQLTQAKSQGVQRSARSVESVANAVWSAQSLARTRGRSKSSSKPSMNFMDRSVSCPHPPHRTTPHTRPTVGTTHPDRTVTVSQLALGAPRRDEV